MAVGLLDGEQMDPLATATGPEQLVEPRPVVLGAVAVNFLPGQQRCDFGGDLNDRAAKFDKVVRSEPV